MMNTQIGIWLDEDKALVVTPSEETEQLKTIISEIEHYHLHGGSGSSTPYGPQDAVSESKLLERKKHQREVFFEKIIAQLGNTSSIALFGPAETKKELAKALQKHPAYKEKVVAVETADSMTENQVKALVRDFFSN